MFRKKFGSKNKKTNKNNLDSWERFEGGQATVNGGRLTTATTTTATTTI